MATSTSSQYLSEKTSHLEAQAPVAPSEARAAQIPLKDFNLPTFPPEAFMAGLTSLILTNDIKMDEYQQLLEKPFSVPKLPGSITSLTLELFSLGYPRGFLVELCKAIPDIKALTLYAQLFAGTTDGSKEDAISFLTGLKNLKEVHFLDVFTPPTVMSEIATSLAPETVFVELSYTYRHSDPGFAKGLPAGEMTGFVRSGVKALRLAMQAPDVSALDEEDREGTEVGILPVSNEAVTMMVINALLEYGKDLVLLDLTLFEISVKDVIVVLGACPVLRVLALSVVLEKGWDELFTELKGKLGSVESLELIGVPGREAVEGLQSKETFLESDVLGDLGGEVKAVTISVLRTKAETWSKETGSWVKLG
jgi:hypothetical protein